MSQVTEVVVTENGRKAMGKIYVEFFLIDLGILCCLVQPQYILNPKYDIFTEKKVKKILLSHSIFYFQGINTIVF